VTARGPEDATKRQTRPKPGHALSIPPRHIRESFFFEWMTQIMLDGMDAAERLGLPAESNPLASLAALLRSLERRRQPVLARFLIGIAHRALKATCPAHRMPRLGKRQRLVFQSLRYSLELVWWLTWLGNATPSCLTALAVLLAGRKRSALADEWGAHLAGEGGHDPVTWPKVRQALGFVASGVRFRLADAADLAWRPVDAVLASRALSNLFVWAPVIAVVVAIVRHDGRFGLVADDQDPVALGAFLYVVIKTGRWWRGVKPPEPKPRRARE
jgi:hypothetical protein